MCLTPCLLEPTSRHFASHRDEDSHKAQKFKCQSNASKKATNGNNIYRSDSVITGPSIPVETLKSIANSN